MGNLKDSQHWWGYQKLASEGMVLPLNFAALDRWCLAFLWEQNAIEWSSWPKSITGQLQNPLSYLTTLGHSEFVNDSSQQIRFATKYAGLWESLNCDLCSNDCKQISDAWAKLDHITSPAGQVTERVQRQSCESEEPPGSFVENTFVCLMKNAVLSEAFELKRPQEALYKLQSFLDSRKAHKLSQFNGQSLRNLVCRLVLSFPINEDEQSNLLSLKQRSLLVRRVITLAFDSASISYPEHSVLPRVLTLFGLTDKVYLSLKTKDEHRRTPLLQKVTTEKVTPLAKLLNFEDHNQTVSSIFLGDEPSADRGATCFSDRIATDLAGLVGCSKRLARATLSIARTGKSSYFYHPTAMCGLEKQKSVNDFENTLYQTSARSRNAIQKFPLKDSKFTKSCDAAGSNFAHGLKLARWHKEGKTSLLEQALMDYVDLISYDRDQLSALVTTHLAERGFPASLFKRPLAASEAKAGLLRREVMSCLPDVTKYFPQAEDLTGYSLIFTQSNLQSASLIDTICKLDNDSTVGETQTLNYLEPGNTPLARLCKLLDNKLPPLPQSYADLLTFLMAIEHCIVASFYQKQAIGNRVSSLHEQALGSEPQNGAEQQWWSSACSTLSAKLRGHNRPYFVDLLGEPLLCATLQLPFADSFPALYLQHKRLFTIAMSLVDNHILPHFQSSEPNNSLAILLKSFSVNCKHVLNVCPHLDVAPGLFNTLQLLDDVQVAVMLNYISFRTPEDRVAPSMSSSNKRALDSQSIEPKTKSFRGVDPQLDALQPTPYTKNVAMKHALKQMLEPKKACEQSMDAEWIALSSNRLYDSLAPRSYSPSAGFKWKSLVNYVPFSPIFSATSAIERLSTQLNFDRVDKPSIVSFLHPTSYTKNLSKVQLTSKFYNFCNTDGLNDYGKSDDKVGTKSGPSQSSILQFFRPKTPPQAISNERETLSSGNPFSLLSWGSEYPLSHDRLVRLAQASIAPIASEESPNLLWSLLPSVFRDNSSVESITGNSLQRFISPLEARGSDAILLESPLSADISFDELDHEFDP